MTSKKESHRTVFGVPVVLTASEVSVLTRDLTQLWLLTYGSLPGAIRGDKELCRRFFDPLVRGQSLRDRLATIPPTPQDLVRRLGRFGYPLVTDVGEGTILIGVEGRLMLEILMEEDLSDGHVVLSQSVTGAAEREALNLYREWSSGRLIQVVNLRAGQGREVMQAIAVGLTISILVNRSDSPERAVPQWDNRDPEGGPLNRAIFAGAERFAELVSGNRRGRSQHQQQLISGYALTEARRRLAHRLVIEKRDPDKKGRLYIPERYRDDVVAFLGRDLARRPTLNHDRLASAFDQLVAAFRASAGQLAYESVAFDRPADTHTLRRRLLDSFDRSRDEWSHDKPLGADHDSLPTQQD
ncbi:hypothetical protein Nm8I071_63130 [Nonomuraea sp. TT08I-71]|nr:hypothetical protein Nm8I071_63130 [Nonomuraea sp. TT08I-71]